MSKTTTTTPTKLTDVPEYRAAADRYDSLSAELAEIQDQLKELELRRRTIGSRTVTEVERLAREKIGLPVGDDEVEGDLDRKIDDLEKQFAATKRARELQKRRIAEARQVASREICTAVYPRFEKLARVVGEALERLALALDREEEFRTSLLDADVCLCEGVRCAGVIDAGFENLYAEWANQNGDLYPLPERGDK